MTRFARLASVVLALNLVWVAGCPSTDGLLFSALAKLASGNIGALTAGEWQAVVDAGVDLAGEPIDGQPLPRLTAQQATAIVEFLDVNDVDTVADLNALFQAGNVVIPETLLDLFL